MSLHFKVSINNASRVVLWFLVCLNPSMGLYSDSTTSAAKARVVILQVLQKVCPLYHAHKVSLFLGRHYW